MSRSIENRVSLDPERLHATTTPARDNVTDEPRKTLSDGTQIYPGHRNLRPNGQQEGYVVLAEEERAKGFVRPVRRSYSHVGRDVCGRLESTGFQKATGRICGHPATDVISRSVFLSTNFTPFG